MEYGATTSYGSTTPVDSTRVTSHAVTISGLSEAKQYHYRERSTGWNFVTSFYGCGYT